MRILYLFSVVFYFCVIYIHSLKGDQSLCPLIFEFARESCSANTESQCEKAGCCWDPDAERKSVKCYKKECQDGYFGYGCRFHCSCEDNSSCDKYSGACLNNKCTPTRWGVGCMLDDDCTYNDQYGLRYLGSKSVAENGKACKPWSIQMAYPDSQFPEANKTVASNFCRNPEPADYRTWCYYRYGSNSKDRRWHYCSLAHCECALGRWGVNCVGECHCSDDQEQCDQKTGECISGCAPGWFGTNCQDCEDGSFGVLCEKQCWCSDAAEVCDKSTGHCVSGCDAGRWGDDCQKECEDRYFGLRCEYQCNCADSSEVCNKSSGACLTGCPRGFAGEGCLLALSPVCESKCLDPFEDCPTKNMSCKSGCAPRWASIRCHLEVPVLKRTPQLVSRTSTSFEVKWYKWRNPPDQGDGPVGSYSVQYKSGAESGWQEEKTTALQANVTALVSGQLYQVRIVPVHEQGFDGLGSPEINVNTCGVPLGRVTSLRLSFSDDLPVAPVLDSSDENTDSDLGYIVASWRPADLNTWGCDRVLKYKVYLLYPHHPDFTFYGETSQTTRISVGNIDQFSNYSIAVTFVNNMGFESERAVKTIIGKCGPVQDMVIQSEVHALGVYWKPPVRSNGAMETYLLRYRHLKQADCEAARKNWLPIIDIPLSFNSYTVTDLGPYSQYEVRVWARTAAGKGEQVIKKVYTEPVIPSGTVTNLKQENLTSVLSSFTWKPPSCDSRHGRPAGYTVKLFSIDNHDKVLQSHTINQTSITLRDLIPYESYMLEVVYLNHVGPGPAQTIGFRTLEDIPPPPSNLHLTLTLSDKLSVAWDPPNPPHGLISKYELKHWRTSSTQAGPPVEIMADSTHFILSGLPPNVSYAFQVRAFTVKGAGDWTSTVYGFTEETYPTKPQSLKNTSRDTYEITLEWKSPLKPNGILRDYKVECLPKRALGRYLTSDGSQGDPKPAFVKNNVQRYTVRNLSPGAEYNCEVRASTRMGFGPPIKRTFFTLPEKPQKPSVPELEMSASTDSTVTLNLQPTQYVILNFENSVIQHRVVVERMKQREKKATERKSKRSSSESMPCSESHLTLTDYFTAKKMHKNCYIAAELPRLDRRQKFVVGDNKTHGLYFNAPLEKDQEYGIWFSVAVTVDGTTIATYTKLDKPVVASVYIESAAGPASSRVAVLAGVAAGVILLVVLLALVLVIFVTRKRKRGSKLQQENATRTESEGLTSSPRVSHHEKSKPRPVIPKVTPTLKTSNITRTKTCSTMDPFHASDSEPEPDDYEHPVANEKAATLRRTIATENLWNYIRDKKASKSNGFKQEYDEIPLGLIAMSEAARRPENRNLNRYGNIIAYDHSRVKLENCSSTGSDYINANYIDAYCRPNAWIATQGPSKYTLSDIWHMVWQERSHRIIMVTNLIEDGRHKCDQYWPDTGTKAYGDITVEKLEEEQFADFTIRTFNMVKQEVETPRIVRQFHFTAWPDHGCPTYATSLIAFRKKVRSYDDPTVGPTVVHCSAGVGRTGTFVALDSLLDQAKNENVVDVYNVVHCMRSKRVNMVQTQEQYEFVYEALLEALKSGDTAIPCRDFRKRYLDLLNKNPDTGKQRLAEEYELLSVMAPPVTTTGCKDALDTDNACKNRSQEIIPLDNLARPYLMTYIPGSSDYINAVFSDGYKHRDAYIITQMPLPQTVVDLWAMCYDHECSAVVMMNELDVTDPTCACYYPVQAGSQTYGPFTIETVALDSTYPDITIRDMTLSISKKGSEPRSVRQFQYHGWPQEQNLPLRKPAVIQLLQLIEKWQQRSGNKTIVVHCIDGASRSGLLCAISYMIERLKVEQEVDVFNSVKHTRINRPNLIPTLEQYQFMYDMAEEYMDCFDTYANFK